MPKLPSASTCGGWELFQPPDPQPHRGGGSADPHAGIPCPGTTQCCSLQPLPRACSLFTLTLEQQLEGGRQQRSALRILASPGACTELYVWELQLGPALPSHTAPRSIPSVRVSLGRAPHPTLPAPGTALPWIMERLLEGNSLTFLLLCVTLPGSAGTSRSPPAVALCQPWDVARLLPWAHCCPRHPQRADPGCPGAG